MKTVRVILAKNQPKIHIIESRGDQWNGVIISADEVSPLLLSTLLEDPEVQMSEETRQTIEALLSRWK